MQRVTRSQAGRTACNACHLRKVRCDAQEVGFPCSNCRNGLREGCRRHEKRKRRSARPPEPEPSPVAALTATPTHARTPPASLAGVPVSPATAPLSPSSAGWHLVEFIDQPELTIRPIDKDARLTYVGADVSNLNFLVQQQFGARTASVFHFPANRIARPDVDLSAEAFQLPAKDVVDRLLDAYFTRVNPGFPVVDEVLFMKQYRARDPQNPPSLLLLHAILLVGAHASLPQPDHEVLKTMFYRRAKSLFDARFEANRDTVVQAALLLTWHSEGPEDVSANAWFWLGIAVTTAKGLGMYRNAEDSTLVPHNKRMWRRVWWLLFQCDVLVSLQYGRPLSIHLEDSDVQRLRASDFQDCGENCRVDYVMQLNELCTIVSRILRERFRIAATTERRHALIQEMDNALANWSLRLSPSLQLHASPTTDLWTANLQLVYNMVLILIHRTQLDEHALREDSDICITAAAAIQSIFRDLCERDELRHLWSSSVNCLFTALIQLNIEVRLSNPVLAISALRRYDSALLSLRELARYWPNAQTILTFFESSLRLQQPRRHGTGTEVLDPPAPNPATAPSCGSGLKDVATVGTEAGQVTQEFPVADPASSGQTDVGSRACSPMPPDHERHRQNGSAPEEQAAFDDVHGGFGDIQASWSEWKELYWQQPVFADEVLFTF
ncbi:Uu.00g048240.m01.CDS01 [Anthostomella pinea]|uniref:Uu.00g048240.m01.CDS01 n=1 Tax=Anthostomella pinea TaxID=933095 RepID=A0AAI8VCP2_9PEZI|nr:Uu.00g048240.m01.CDS01 [Anthostomella pinea]